MKLELMQNMRLEQKLKMSPQLIQRIEILQLQSMDLKELIENELMENEVLEQVEPLEEIKQTEGSDRSDSIDGNGDDARDGDDDDSFSLDEEMERLKNMIEMNKDRTRTGSSHKSGEDDPKFRAMQNTMSRPMTLQDHLKNQLGLSDCDQDIRIIAEQIIYNINDRGYLLYPLEEIHMPSAGDHTQAKKEEALVLVQSFEPTGVGARDLRECLLLQLDASHTDHELMRKIIVDHIEDLSKNQLPKIAKRTSRSIEEVQDALENISHLDPIPGRLFRTDPIPYVNPDVVLELIDGEYEIQLQNDYYPKLGISEAYLKMYMDKSLDPKLRMHFRKKIESAKWLIESIEQRRSTLSRVVDVLVKHQRDFLDRGTKHLKPLKMQEVADKLGLHVSTISRTISDKYVQAPRGIFSLKSFFTGATKSSDGEVESRVGVKQKVKDLIDNENKTKPLSDQEIMKILEMEGLSIARRTVTKYRKALNVPSSRQRRVY